VLDTSLLPGHSAADGFGPDRSPSVGGAGMVGSPSQVGRRTPSRGLRPGTSGGGGDPALPLIREGRGGGSRGHTASRGTLMSPGGASVGFLSQGVGSRGGTHGSDSDADDEGLDDGLWDTRLSLTGGALEGTGPLPPIQRSKVQARLAHTRAALSHYEGLVEAAQLKFEKWYEGRFERPFGQPYKPHYVPGEEGADAGAGGVAAPTGSGAAVGGDGFDPSIPIGSIGLSTRFRRNIALPLPPPAPPLNPDPPIHHPLFFETEMDGGLDHPGVEPSIWRKECLGVHLIDGPYSTDVRHVCVCLCVRARPCSSRAPRGR
jgi:hypothetical protein